MTKNPTRHTDFVFRIAFLLVYGTSLFIPSQTIDAAPAPVQQPVIAPEIKLAQPIASAPGPEPLEGGSLIVNSSDFKSAKSSLDIAQQLKLLGYTTPTAYPIYSTLNGLTIEPITAYNLIVDSNVLAPSSYGPSAATVGAKFCNTNSSAALTNVWAYTGNYDTNYDGTVGDTTVGSFPRRFYDGVTTYYDSAAFNSAYGSGTNILVGATATDYGATSTPFALKLETGTTSATNDGSRYVGTLAAGECKTQYWLVSYPRKALVGGTWKDVTGGVKPDDDLWLPYFFWGTSTLSGSTNTSYRWNVVTMRNEISAMANKIWPNGDNKVPDQYIAAIQQVLGWDTWTPSDPTGATAYPGETVTSQGIWYDLGNVGAGFDNNGDFVPDRNIWVQPIGDASSYDPGCFRLARTYGLVIVKLNDGTELLIPFVDQMYFENIPDNNNGAVGLVFYEYLAMDGVCTAGLTPYQEVASGYDNEKFNGDFGAGIPPLQSRESNMTLDKTGQTTIGLGGTINYSMTFSLPDVDTGDATTTVTLGNPAYGMPLTFYEPVPVGLQYIAGSASTNVTMTNYTTPQSAIVLFSTDGGAVWTTTDPGNYTSSSTSNQLVIRWQFVNAITSPATGSPVTGTVTFNATVPVAYTGKVVSNTTCMKLGNASCIVEDTHNTLVLGAYSISGTVFCDDGSQYTASGACSGTTSGGVLGNATLDTGGSEPGIPGIAVTLYYDANNDNAIDSGDTVIASMNSLNYNVIDGYVDVDNSGTITTADDTSFPNINVIDGGLDLNGDGAITATDDGAFGGYTVIDGRIDINVSGTLTTADDGTLLGIYNFGRLPAGNYLVQADSVDTDLPTGYTNTTPILRNADIVAANLTGINYGFAPALTLVKRLDSPQTTIIGQTADVQYTLRLTNNIPGSGGPTSYCTYRVWASQAHTTTGPNPDGGGPSNAQFQSPNNALSAPDAAFATTVMLDNTDIIGLTGFNIADLGGNITNVKTIVYMKETVDFDDDTFIIRPFYNNAQLGTDITYSSSFFSSSVGTVYTLTDDITSRRAWVWSDFQPIVADGETMTEIQIEGNRVGGTSGDVGVDAVAFEITTDQTCNDPGQIINPLPLTDTFESYYMSFVSANPPSSSSNTTGSGTSQLTTLTWDNVGPLYPGQTKEIVVTFHADQLTAGNSYLTANKADNTADVTTAKFGNGRDTNDVSATTPVEIVAPRSISGTVWFDIDADGWQGTNGYETSPTDGKIPNVKVTLLGCALADGYFAVDTGTNITGNDQCSELSGGNWIEYDTAITDSNGAYSFTGLYQGYYRVVVDTTTLPAGATQTGDSNDHTNLCGVCDHQMGATTDNLQSGEIINLDTSTTATNINFGYDYAAAIYGIVWENLDGDRVKDSGENPLSGVTVRLYNWTDDGDNLVEAGEVGTLVSSDTTDTNGDFFFASGITGGNKYLVNVDTSSLPSGSTWTITDEDNPGASDDPISGGNEYNYIGVTAVANANTGSLEFGVTRSGTKRIGDTLFYDWDADGTQDSADEGIPNVTIKLYTDTDGDGIVESGDYLVSTSATFAYKVIDGYLDIDRDGVTAADAGDDYTNITGIIDVIDGRLDMDSDGDIDANDDGAFLGVAVIDGYIDIDGDGVTSADGGDDFDIGQYTFNSLSTRNYVVVVDTTDPQFPTLLTGSKDPDESGQCVICNNKSTVTAAEIIADADGNINTEDFGYYPFGGGSIGDTVFKDVNGNGVQVGTLETGIANITVSLQVDLNGDGTYVTIATDITDSNGKYLFNNLPTSLSSSVTSVSYRVVVDIADSDLPKDPFGFIYQPSTASTYSPTLTNASPTYLTADFGFAAPASIGDTIYWDSNVNGTQDTGEPGINGVTVNLYKFIDAGDEDGSYDLGESFLDLNNDGDWDTGEPWKDVKDSRYGPGEYFYTDSDGDGVWDVGETSSANPASVTAVSSTTTATTNGQDGKYIFSGLYTNTNGVGYTVIVDTSTGGLSGKTLTADPNVDGLVCTDLNNPADANEPNVKLCDSREGMKLYPGTSYTGADFGYMPSGVIGDTLWIDTDSDGVRDATEIGIDNVTVRLCNDSACASVVTTTTTDSNGNYFFTNIGNGTYYVVVDTTDADLTGIGVTQTFEKNDPSPENVTQVVMTAGAVSSINGTACANCGLDVDFGYRYAGNTTLSGTICLEATVDGVCGDNTTDNSGVGSGETAYGSATVFLYRWNDADTDNIIDSGETTLVSTTATDASGDYSFIGVTDGVYYIIAIGAPQDGLDLTSTQATVNTSGDAATTSYVETTAFDGDTLSAYQVVNTAGDTNIQDRDFAFKLNGTFDFGDLPQGMINGVGVNYNYSTTMQGNPDGARHQAPAGGFTLYLGGAPDTETNGVSSALANGDDSNGTSDENGVAVPFTNTENTDGWADGLGRIDFDINTTSGSGSGWLIGWIDYNRDGDFADANEMAISRSVTDAVGVQTLDIVTPLTTISNGGLFARFRVFTSQPAIPSLAYTGMAVNGEVEDYVIFINNGAPVSTPITVSYFRAQRQGSAVDFDWSTATETGNLGFNLYVETDDTLTLINSELIDSKVLDSLNRQDYSFSADVAGNSFYIEDVSILGETRQHGPFHLGQEFGAHLEEDKVDQAALHSEHDGKFTENQNKIKKDLKLPAAALQAATTQPGLQLTTSLNLKVRQTGIQRVTYEMLQNAGLDLAGVPISKITLTNRGQMIPVYVQGNGKFAPGGFIEFYGEALDTAYTDTNIYTLQVSQSPADRIQGNSASAGNGLTSPASYSETLMVNNQRVYANYSPSVDAWYDTVMTTKVLKSWNFPFEVNGLAGSSAPANLELVVWGVTSVANHPGHHLLVSLNGVPLADETFKGLVEHTVKVSLPAGVLHDGTNNLQLTLPNNLGASSDTVNLDKFSITYQRLFQAQAGRLTFTSAGKVFNVTNLPSQNVVVYRLTEKGPIRLDKVQVKSSGATFTATFAGSNLTEKYLVTTVEALYTPVLEATRLQADLNRPAQYLIIAHPDFISGLQPLVLARQAQGMTVSVVDVTDLYTQYTYGVFDPQAIKQYVSYAARNLGTKYVLLVGGDTYDYRNYLGRNSISFIPSLYIPTSPLVHFTPVDPQYADLNNDNVPDLAIGRFPVRSTAELNMMVNKTLAYAGKNYGRTAVFATDKNDGTLAFKNISASFSVNMPANWSVQNIHLGDTTLANAQNQLIAAMNKGTALVTFTGHSSPFAWAASNLFTTKNAAALTNTGRPFMLVQWGCWNTYYVDPVNNGLVQSFLFSGDKGAAAVMGAVTLTEAGSEQLLGELLTPRLVMPKMTIGQAMQDAKVELAQTHPELIDVLLGWSLMGDPTLVIEP